jgi:hypothetical protein
MFSNEEIEALVGTAVLSAGPEWQLVAVEREQDWRLAAVKQVPATVLLRFLITVRFREGLAHKIRLIVPDVATADWVVKTVRRRLDKLKPKSRK